MKLLSLVASISLAVVLVGCQGETPTSGEGGSTPDASATDTSTDLGEPQSLPGESAAPAEGNAPAATGEGATDGPLLPPPGN